MRMEKLQVHVLQFTENQHFVRYYIQITTFIISFLNRVYAVEFKIYPSRQETLQRIGSTWEKRRSTKTIHKSFIDGH